jgi:hypothetical protein
MSKIDISQTNICLPKDIKWVGQPGFPDRSLENAVLAGDLNGKGIYYTLSDNDEAAAFAGLAAANLI